MYHVLPIGIISIVFYFLSLLSLKAGILNRKTHKAIWNSLLLISFISTASAGIFLALQSNYKWDIRAYEKFLSWHVQFGIGMSFTGIIHLTWHLSYFSGLFNRKQIFEESRETDNSRLYPQQVKISLFLLGFITTICQVVFLKEILNLGGGYEFLSAMVLSFWIILSAIGVKLARNNKGVNPGTMSLLLPLICLFSFIIFIALIRFLLPTGTTPSLIFTIIITILSLLPICIFSGLLFVKLSIAGHYKDSLKAGKSYAIETIGGICSGLLITILSGNILGNFQFILLSVCIYYMITLIWSDSKFRAYGIILSAFVFIMVILIKPDTFFRNILLKGINVSESIDSKYGNITISESNGETSIFYNHRLINFEDDIRTREENIHYAMIQHVNPKNILLLSGGLSNHLPEILKYQGVRSVTYLEKDPSLNTFQNVIDPDTLSIEIRLIQDDAMRFLKETDTTFDIIISLHSNPDNLATNRLFTREFFNICNERLAKDGIIMIKAGYGSNYINKQELKAIAAVFNSMDGVFRHTAAMPGESVYFLGSDKPLKLDIESSFDLKGIQNTYVNSYYLNNDIINFNSQQITEEISSSININTLNKPVAVFYRQQYELAKSSNSQTILIILFSGALIIPVLIIRKNARIMYTSSLNLAGMEILALLLIQSTSGNIYQLVSLVITVMMAGLAVGSYFKLRIIKDKPNLVLLLLSAFAVIAAFSSLSVLNMKPGIILSSIILLIAFFPAVLCGHLYKEKTHSKNIAKSISDIYFADLAGAALGFLIISALIIPLIGIKSTFFMLASLNFAAYISMQQIKN